MFLFELWLDIYDFRQFDYVWLWYIEFLFLLYYWFQVKVYYKYILILSIWFSYTCLNQIYFLLETMISYIWLWTIWLWIDFDTQTNGGYSSVFCLGIIHWYSDTQTNWYSDTQPMEVIHWYFDAQSWGYSVTIVIRLLRL